ncbi:YdbL family protein [Shigella flexneri]|nr:YdbL family protein [Shigella flexneri]
MMKKTLLLCAFLVGLVSSNVMALTLDEARTQGVGETFYGYLVALKTDAETEKLVTEINAERKASYQQRAKQNNVSVDDIAKLAGQKLVARAKPGEYVQGINGKWVRKF